MKIGLAIKRSREQLGYKQTDLAQKTGLSVSYLSMLEKNKRDPSIKTVERIALALGIPPSVLLLLALDPAELAPLDQTVAEKIAYLAMTYLREKPHEQTLI